MDGTRTGKDYIEIARQKLGLPEMADMEPGDLERLAHCLSADLALTVTRLENYRKQIESLIELCKKTNIPDKTIDRFLKNTVSGKRHPDRYSERRVTASPKKSKKMGKIGDDFTP